jgi:hypothetical protein
MQMTLRQDELMPIKSEIVPIWVGHYLGLPYKSNGRCREGLDSWGLVRLVLAEQYGLAIPSHSLINDQAIFDITRRKENYNYYGKYIVAVNPFIGDYLFGIKLPNNRMLTMFSSKSGLMRYNENLLKGEE